MPTQNSRTGKVKIMAEKKTVELYFDGELMKCTREEDRNGEHLFVAPNGRFAKFPKNADLDEAIQVHNDANKDEVEIVEEIKYADVTHFDKDGNEVK